MRVDQTVYELYLAHVCCKSSRHSRRMLVNPPERGCFMMLIIANFQKCCYVYSLFVLSVSQVSLKVVLEVMHLGIIAALVVKYSGLLYFVIWSECFLFQFMHVMLQ